MFTLKLFLCHVDFSGSHVYVEVCNLFVGSDGEGYEVQCGRTTDITVVERLSFSYKKPQGNAVRTLAEVKTMAPRQHVSFYNLLWFYLVLCCEDYRVCGI